MVNLVAVDRLEAAVQKGSGFDAVVLVAQDLASVTIAPLQAVIGALREVDSKADSLLALVAAPKLAGGRLVVAPTGPLQRDHDDVRRFADAARTGMRRARDAGSRTPLLVVATPPSDARYRRAVEVTVLGALGGLWEPLEACEALGSPACEPVERIGCAVLGGTCEPSTLQRLHDVEAGVSAARDLCGTDPERMAPPRFAEYCQDLFASSGVKLEIVRERGALEREYPLLAAVARASQGVERHRPCVIRLQWTGEGAIERTLLFAGKGLTYDTGGADLKAGGVMAGMSRDKGGAAAVAGFLLAVARLRPRGVRVVAELGVVRNSIGADAFVSDEIIKSHAGARVRIGNTDAEGRLVLADLLSHLRERALAEPGPRILSVATLTGHSGRAVGPYNIALDNGPARALGVAESLASAGDLWGDPFEVSRLRREDFDFVAPRSRADDTLSCNNAPSTMTNRGHQFPMAFLAIASGLNAHGGDGNQPLPFTHVDLGGSATEGGDWQHGRPTGRPVVAFLAGLVPGALGA
ncbi:MAG: leucyl aminopeptidase family protein [Planctomycetes bacterium]|nr:leucyl aminopeptidase family protein [Planctomycetota bacterium]